MRNARTGVRRLGGRAQSLRHARRREEIVARLERVTEPILLLLAFGMIPLLLGPFIWELSSAERAVFASLSTAVWVAFTADLVAKLLITPHRKAFLRSHWLEAAIVLVPFFRPLYFVRFILFGSKAALGLRRLADIDFVVVLTAGLVIIAATVMFSVDQTNDRIASFGDSLWWAVVTVTTVGYGDIVPASVGGRVVALFLMVAGIALFGAVAGNVAALLPRLARGGQPAAADTSAVLLREMRALREQVTSLERRVAELDR